MKALITLQCVNTLVLAVGIAILALLQTKKADPTHWDYLEMTEPVTTVRPSIENFDDKLKDDPFQSTAPGDEWEFCGTFVRGDSWKESSGDIETSPPENVFIFKRPSKD